MEDISAMLLEVQAFACRIGRQTDAQRFLRGVSVEPTLDLLAPCTAGEAVDHLDTLLGTVGTFNRLFEDRLQVTLCALAILREDQDAPMVPCRRLALRLLSYGRQVGAQVLAHPVDQP